MGSLARPVAAGLVLLAGLVPTSFDVRTVAPAPRDAFVTRSLATQVRATPSKAAEDDTARAQPIEPLRRRELPTVLAVVRQPAPLPLVIPPAPPGQKPRSPQEAKPLALAQGGQSQPPEPHVRLAFAAAAPPLQLLTPPPAPSPAATPPQPLRRVDIAQIDTGSSPGVRVPQLHEPGLVPGGPNLADKTAAMQVALPPPARLSEQELALLQADAPATMIVRLGEEAVGQVAFRISESRSIDVQLSGLLDVLADRFAPEDFARLRNASAADSFVPLDSLRAIGLSLRYDPVYDELRVSA